MVQERVSGNGNFDIDAIRMAANAMENAPAVIEQPFVDPVADAFAADVQDTADEIRYNPGSNLAEEAMQIMNAPGAAKLGAGVLADLRAAVQLQEEKAANGADAFLRGDRVWEERKDREDRDRREQSRAADIADDFQNAEERRQTEVERQQRADVWNNSDHTYAGQRMSADEWLRMIQWFKQPENRAAWEDAMMAETGQSRDQVRRTGDKIAELDALIERESRGEVLTAEEQARKTRLENDAQVRRGIELRTTLADPTLARSSEMNNQNGAASVEAGSDALTMADPSSSHIITAESGQFSGTSVARDADGISANGERLNATFARAATGELPASPVVPQLAVAQPRVAANFDVNAGMI